MAASTASAAATLPTVATIPVQTRSERFRSPRVADFPEVTGLEAEWKHTPVARLTPLLDGPLDGSPLPYEASGVSGVTFEWIDRADASVGAAGVPEDRASAAAWTAFEKALKVTVSGEGATATVLRSGLGTSARAAHTVIVAEPNSSGIVVLEGTGDAMLAENVEFLIGAGARLEVVSVQEWAADAVHLASHFARLEAGSELTHSVVSLGGGVVRVNPSAHLAGERASVQLFGVYFADAGQHLEQQVFVHHDAPDTVSRVTYKGALQGRGAHTVWIGDVLIGQRATGTDSYEQNRNLMLTDGARADSVPNLEIETGDIVGAGHASASGRFDDEQLFYLQARGIPEPDARRLVVRGFLAEVLHKIGSPDLVDRLERAVESELSGGGTSAA